MKKIVTLLFSLLLLSGCSVSSNDKKPDTASNTTQHVEMEDTFGTEEIEITFTNKAITSTANWTWDDGTSFELKEVPDQMYLILRGSVKNTASTEVDFYHNLIATVTLDGKYSYDFKTASRADTGIIPLKTDSFAMYAELPKEVLNVCTGYQLLLGFNNGFSKVDNLDSCDNIYSLDGTLDEYGSADNIQNFQMFQEFITQQVNSQNPNLGIDIDGECVDIHVDKGAFWMLQLDDGARFSVTSKIKLNYGIFDIYDDTDEDCGYASLCFAVKDFSSSDIDARYIGAKSITILSDTGKIELDEKSGAFFYSYDCDSNYKSTVTFIFPSNKVSFVELQNVINGENPKMVFELEKHGADEYVTSEINLDKESVNSLNAYLEFYKSLPLALFD